MRVGWDLDGVEHAFERGMFETIDHLGLADRYDYKTAFPTGEPCCWTWYTHLGMNLDEFLEVAHAGADLGFVFRGHPIGDPTQMRRVRDAGHTVHIITDRSFGTTPEVSQEATRRFLEDFGYQYDSLTFSRDKTIVPVDAMIDDRIENYDALDAEGVEVYLLDRPWNQSDIVRRRVYSTKEFVDIILVDRKYAIL